MAEDDRTMEAEQAGFPPRPPQVGRQTRLHAYQWIGLPLMAAVVIAALAGAFGETWQSGTTRVDGLTVEHRHPTRLRYKTIDLITLQVSNTSAAALDTVTVSFDSAYMSRFSNLSIVPSPTRAWEVELIGVAAGETRRVVAEIQAERYWRHDGSIEVTAPGLDTVRVPLSTTTLP